MEKEFIPYTEALALKKLGFDEPCLGYYVNVEVPSPFLVTTKIFDTQGGYFTFAPTFSQAFRWFREKYQLCNFINFSSDGFCSGWEDLGNNEHGFENFKTYEEAELNCLKKLIEIVKNK
jgi:hypothetical protein